MFLGVIVAVAGWPLYRIHVVQGTSVIVEITQLYIAAIRNRNLQLPGNPLELYEIDNDKEATLEDDFLPHRDVYRFLDKAAIQTASPAQTPNLRKLCRVSQVENAKIIPGMIPIFACTIIMTPLPSSAPNLFCPTRPYHGYNDRWLFPHTSCLSTNNSYRFLDRHNSLL